MSYRLLKAVADSFKDMNINYAFKVWKGKVEYPYWVSDYIETENMNEDGKQETSIILTGYSRGNATQLEMQKDMIQNRFRNGEKSTSEDGYAVVIFYGSTNSNIPTADIELTRIQINLTCFEYASE